MILPLSILIKSQLNFKQERNFFFERLVDYHSGCVIFITAKICEITRFPNKMKEPVSGMLYFKIVCKYGLFNTGKWNIVVQHL